MKRRNISRMQIDNSIIKFILAFVLLFSTVVNGSHASDVCLDNCESIISIPDQPSIDIKNGILLNHSDKNSEHSETNHEELCSCHSHNFLQQRQIVSIQNSVPLSIEISPKYMISDPHTRSPFLPPKA